MGPVCTLSRSRRAALRAGALRFPSRFLAFPVKKETPEAAVKCFHQIASRIHLDEGNLVAPT